jgi:hypothetical protein
MLTLLVCACSTVKESSKTPVTVDLSSNDSAEYEIIITDIHFDLWYQMNYNEAKDRTVDYYRSKILVAVQRWNDYYRQGKSIEVIDSYIDYQPQIDYGIEVNRKLFWYFKFVEDYYKVKLYW